MHRLRLSIVIPAYNEAKRIWSSLDTIRRTMHGSRFDWDVRVVDDGSVDDTAAIVDRVARVDRRVTLQREPHRGKGGAVRAGMLAARGDVRFLCDADLSMPMGELPRFVDKVARGCDIAIGSREGESARRVGEPFYRHAMGRVFNALVQKAVLPDVQDTQCGFKMFTAHAARSVFAAATIDGWAFDIEALVIARTQGWRIGEVPIEWHYGADSRVRAFRDSYRMLRDLWRIRAKSRGGAYREPASASSWASAAEEYASRARPGRVRRDTRGRSSASR